MPMYDRQCKKCGKQRIDCWEPMTAPEVKCDCGGEMERVLLPSSASNVLPDDIPGGIEIRHGLCNMDGSPRTYYSRSEMKKEAEKRGLVNYVVHQTEGLHGDRNKHTTRWI